MSEIANYTFLPWLRHGIANEISGQTGVRATIGIDLTVEGEKVGGGKETKPPIHRDVEIYGPGDIIGIDQTSIIKVEPRNWITNFEPNYLPYIEFYDEDFPWRYSPKQANGHKLIPWIMLVVLKEEEFTDGKQIKDRPLPYVTFTGAAPLPPSDQLWAWSHVHINKNIIGNDFETDDAANIGAKLETTIKANPDLAYSRILCPRKLEEKTGYHAFLVPVFKTGMLAALGQDPADAATFDELAWTEASAPQELPYFYRWHFRTGTVGDFEYLVRLLKPQPVDSRVGLREMDVQVPGANIRGIVDAPAAPEEQKLDGILKLGGALRIPDIFYTPEEFVIVQKYRNWATLSQPYPHPFQEDLASFVNLSDGYQLEGALEANNKANITEEPHEPGDPTDLEKDFAIDQNPDPLITAPLYGQWHALSQRLLKDRDDSDLNPNDNWVHDLNLDPRWRVAAGFGTKIVQENQEDYMSAAWEQVGEILESNKRIRQAQLAAGASMVWHQSHILPLKEDSNSKWLTIAAPLHARVVTEGLTISHKVKTSMIPKAVFSAQTRKLLRPRGRLVKRLPFNSEITADNLVHRINEGIVSAAPPRVDPEVVTVEDVADALRPTNIPAPLVDLVEANPELRWILLIIAIILIVLLLLFGASMILLGIGLVIAGILLFLFYQFGRVEEQLDLAGSVLDENQTPEAIDELPKSPDFRISVPAEQFNPTFGGNADSDEGARFKAALKDVNFMLQDSFRLGAKPFKPKLDIARVADGAFEKLHPQITIPNWVWGSVVVPGWILENMKEEFVEAMAYPEIDLPMYKPLAEQSAELFLPNINFIAQNSISLLETNQKFIESYMVGLNHEFARELLWREYPTDQRGSYFRQFWEPQSFHDTEGLTEEELKEKLRDIPPIHLWSKFSDLGDHDHREVPGENEEEVVLVIRGELLKRYPDAIIYAHRAVWRDDTDDGNPILDISGGQTIDTGKERDLRPLTEAEEANPPRTILKTPLYEAKVDPDIYFFGFDLTVCEAKGGTGKESEEVDDRCKQEGIQWHDPGWFFVIKERPGEIAMGLDIPQDGNSLDSVKVWNDLSWDLVTPAVTGGDFLQINDQTLEIELKSLTLPDEAEKETQKGEDSNIRWHKGMSSADLAYILYQVPILVAVHGSEMLPEQ